MMRLWLGNSLWLNSINFKSSLLKLLKREMLLNKSFRKLKLRRLLMSTPSFAWTVERTSMKRKTSTGAAKCIGLITGIICGGVVERGISMRRVARGKNTVQEKRRRKTVKMTFLVIKPDFRNAHVAKSLVIWRKNAREILTIDRLSIQKMKRRESRRTKRKVRDCWQILK